MDQLIIWQIIVLLVLIPLFFLPTIIAIKRNHPYKVPIILINIIGGLMWGIGWLIALVWSFIMPNHSTNPSLNVASEIDKLHALLEKGALTQEEFDAKKSALLKA